MYTSWGFASDKYVPTSCRRKCHLITQDIFRRIVWIRRIRVNIFVRHPRFFGERKKWMAFELQYVVFSHLIHYFVSLFRGELVAV